MTPDFEDIKLYLPKYLSDADKKKLFSELRSFPHNIDERLYTSALRQTDTIYQGDGLNQMLFADFPNRKFVEGIKGVMVSNTCDISPENKRLFEPILSYAPVFSLRRYEEKLTSSASAVEKAKIAGHLDAIRKQSVTQFFYLPKCEGLKEECFCRFDLINSVPSGSFKPEALRANRLFSLSDFGFYMFAVKLSIHFCRLQEDVQRGDAA